MPGRIVLYGATGYTGALTAQALVASGARPVLAGRDQSRLSALAARLSRAGDGTELETAVAAAEGPGPLRDLLGTGDVLVSTAGPFMKVGRPIVAAAVDAGAVYLDSTGEPPFIREVFEEFGPRAQRTGAVLLTAFGYDFVPGNLAGALALQAAGPGAARVQVGYFVRGDVRRGSSAGTRASMTGVLLEPGYAFRGGRIVSERTAAHVTAFKVGGSKREAYSMGASEHFALPRLRPEAEADGASGQVPLADVSVYLGWFGGATRLVHYGSVLTPLVSGLPGVRGALDAAARRIQRSRAAPGAAAAIHSDVVAVAGDANGKELAAVHLTGGDPYSFTASILAWAAVKAAADGVRPAGALGPVEAFGADLLESACAAAGFHRVQIK
ncbi:MAG: saccharopine dehydrogenase NADP-binding domain-containing protein [Trebonia sp.]|jgi:short subunit dehydrogenase-like uncharacterized protein